MDIECGASGLVALLSPNRVTSPKSPVPDTDEESAAGAAIETPELTQKRTHALAVKFKNVLRELAETERIYLKDLGGIINGYQRQLQACLTEEELDMIFGNMEDLHAFHQDLSSRIDICVEHTPHMIGDVFVLMGLERFMVYEQYYLDHTKSLSFLRHKQEDKTFLTLLVACQTNLGHQLPLADYLLKPVQRLLKYPLLLGELTKAMPTDSPGYPAILAAGTLLKDVADSINEIKRQLDVSRYVDGLQQRLNNWNGPNLQVFGQLKDAGDFKISDATGKKSQRQVLLFESAIMICKPRAGGYVSVKHHFTMDVLFLQTMLNEQLCFRLTVADNKKVYFTFYCQTQEDKQYWIAKIKKVIIEFHTQGQDKTAPAADGDGSKRRGYHFLNRRKKISASHSASLGTIAPVSKKREDNVLLNHNPYAQAGGYDEAPEVKQVVRREEVKRMSRKENRRKELADGLAGESTTDGGSAGETTPSLLTNQRDSVISSTASEGGGPQGIESPPPLRRNAQRRRPSVMSMPYSSRASSPSTPYPGLESPPQYGHHTSMSSLQFSSVNSSPAGPFGHFDGSATDFITRFSVMSPAVHEAESGAPSRDGHRAGVDSGLPDDERPSTLLRCFFPDGAHTSVSVKPDDTLRTALRSRLLRHGHVCEDCIVQLPATGMPGSSRTSITLPWDESAMEALGGHTTILVIKIRASAPPLPRKGSIMRLPSGNSLDLENVDSGVLTPSPKKASPLKDMPRNPRLSYIDPHTHGEPVMDTLTPNRDNTSGERVFCTPEPRQRGSVMDPIHRWTCVVPPETPDMFKTDYSFMPPLDLPAVFIGVSDHASDTEALAITADDPYAEDTTDPHCPSQPAQGQASQAVDAAALHVQHSQVLSELAKPASPPARPEKVAQADWREDPVASPDVRHGVSKEFATVQSGLARAAVRRVRARKSIILDPANEDGEEDAVSAPSDREALVARLAMARAEAATIIDSMDDLANNTSSTAVSDDTSAPAIGQPVAVPRVPKVTAAAINPVVNVMVNAPSEPTDPMALSTASVPLKTTLGEPAKRKKPRRRRRKKIESTTISIYAPSRGPQPKISPHHFRSQRIMPQDRRLDAKISAATAASYTSVESAMQKPTLTKSKPMPKRIMPADRARDSSRRTASTPRLEHNAPVQHRALSRIVSTTTSGSAGSRATD
eukprot:m.261066 g.261066  ORF g.261066 m.261066 type:complete len:1180 (+) comp26657_c0_seq1:244-3783(+)